MLSGKIDGIQPNTHIATLHVMAESGNDILHKFPELEEHPRSNPPMSQEECEVKKHFQTHHYRKQDGRFVVPLPRNPEVKPIGDSQAVRRFLTLEKSLRSKNQFGAFDAVIREYFDLGPVPNNDFDRSQCQVFYLPMHAVYKASSSTTLQNRQREYR